MDFDSSSAVMEFKKNINVPDSIYWNGERFETTSGFSESEETADMYTNLLAGFIVGLEVSGRTTDFSVEPYNRSA